MERRRRRVISEINVVPYIDVMLVLLVIFMVTAPLLMEGVKVELPEVELAQSLRGALSLSLCTSTKKETTISTMIVKRCLNRARFVSRQRLYLKNSPGTQFLVRGDRRVDYDAVMRVIVLLQEAGVSGVGLVTDTPGS
ncbi:MAG: protein TolR [Gammaproteobacteria bacterium]|nr:MAG: protein TolR [Gammaproteobacteria bacterium]